VNAPLQSLRPPVHLGQIAEFIRGVTYKPADVSSADDPGAIACMRTKNIQADLEDDDLVFIPRSPIKESRLLRGGDILVSSANSWNLVGKCCWVPNLPYQATFGGFTSVLRADPTRVFPRYLYHWFATDRTQRLARSFGQQTTNISNLNQARCLELEISLPPLDEQQRIAAILDKADALRRKRKRALDLMEQARDSLIETALQANSSGQVGALKEYLQFITTGGRNWSQYYSEKGPRFIRSLDVQMNSISEEDPAYVTPPNNAEARRTRTQEGDVLLTVTGSRIGRVAELPANLSGSYVSQHVAILRLNREKLRPKFLSFFLSSRAGQRQIQKWQYGQTKPGLNFRQIEDFWIPKISIDFQIQLERTIERFGAVLGVQELHGGQLGNLFSSLQSRAFSGQL
jgi:type I restriction enzyme, S subunit